MTWRSKPSASARRSLWMFFSATGASWRRRISFEGMPPNLTRVAVGIEAAPARCHQDRRAVRFARRQLESCSISRGSRQNIVAVPDGRRGLAGAVPCAARKAARSRTRRSKTPRRPGQISLEEMKRVYRADEFDGRTRVYGVIGNPIGHSLSPAMQNAGFRGPPDERGLFAVSGARPERFPRVRSSRSASVGSA